jgi:hypothetical protein
LLHAPPRPGKNARMPASTPWLARLIGLYSILLGLALIGRRQEMVGIVEALTHNPTQLLLVGMIALGVGLAMVLGHNAWSGGLLPVVVTLIGWLILLRGLLLLFLPAASVAALFEAMHFARLLYLYATIALVLGIYLAMAGFRSAAPPRRAKRRTGA